MTGMNSTPFNKRCEILADLWLEYPDDETYKDFIKYNDLALPFAYALANDLIEYSASGKLESFINEAWDSFLKIVGIEDDSYETLDEVLDTEDVDRF
jgi:hypothetical protein